MVGLNLTPTELVREGLQQVVEELFEIVVEIGSEALQS
ncbi:hypothetical protein A2U01_0057861, partial [Trifolium medium]|nr:hypothetical protein [Trifolium medium]